MSAIGSLGVGALAGALAAHLLRERAEKKRTERERDGLLRILYAEFAESFLAVEINSPTGPIFVRKWLANEVKDDLNTNLQTAAWEATRLKLAQHLSSEEFAVLADFYRRLSRLKTILAGAPLDDQEHYLALSALSILHQRGPAVERLVKKYVPDVLEDPPLIQEGQEEATAG